MSQRRKPVLAGPWRLIAPAPDLSGPFGPGNSPQNKPADVHELNAVVDHHIYQDAAGDWHAWACVRNTKVGRILYHWRSQDFFGWPWEDTGEMIRCEKSCGESVRDYGGMEWLQSPYVVRDGGKFYMFYGGHTTGFDLEGNEMEGNEPRHECQMCLMTSVDGVEWIRHRDGEGMSRVFVGPGEVRDPCVIKIGDLWYCYYAGYSDQKREKPGFFCRTSKDLVNWSEYRCVHEDLKLAGGIWATECPHVVGREGLYYLFRTEHYYERKTHVFCSDDPLDFGVGDASDKYVGMIEVGAPEVIVGPDGKEYVSSVHEPMRGIQVAELGWE